MSRMSGMAASKTWDPGAVTTAAVATTVSVPGAKLGDFALASMNTWTDALADDAVMTACVSSADTVTVTIIGDGTSTNLASGTLRVKVIPFDVI